MCLVQYMKDLILTKNRKRYNSPKMRLRRAKPWILNQRQGFFAMHGRVSALFTKITPANPVFPTTAFIFWMQSFTRKTARRNRSVKRHCCRNRRSTKWSPFFLKADILNSGRYQAYPGRWKRVLECKRIRTGTWLCKMGEFCKSN